MPNALKDHGLLLEALTRARKTVILVTFAKSEFNPLFESASNHDKKPSCKADAGLDTKDCQFLESEVLLEKNKVKMKIYRTGILISLSQCQANIVCQARKNF